MPPQKGGILRLWGGVRLGRTTVRQNATAFCTGVAHDRAAQSRSPAAAGLSPPKGVFGSLIGDIGVGTADVSVVVTIPFYSLGNPN